MKELITMYDLRGDWATDGAKKAILIQVNKKHTDSQQQLLERLSEKLEKEIGSYSDSSEVNFYRRGLIFSKALIQEEIKKL